MYVKSARFFYSVLGSLSNTKKRERNAQKKKRHKSHAKEKIKRRRALFFTSQRARDRERAKKKANEQRCLLE